MEKELDIQKMKLWKYRLKYCLLIPTFACLMPTKVLSIIAWSAFIIAGCLFWVLKLMLNREEQRLLRIKKQKMYEELINLRSSCFESIEKLEDLYHMANWQITRNSILLGFRSRLEYDCRSREDFVGLQHEIANEYIRASKEIELEKRRKSEQQTNENTKNERENQKRKSSFAQGNCINVFLDVLELTEEPKDFEIIKKAYRKMIRRYHPDIIGRSKEDEEQSKKINNAYDVLEKYYTA